MDSLPTKSSDGAPFRLQPGELYFYATSRHCDCGTVIGESHQRKRSSRAVDVEREVAKLAKKGWSQAKIARWVEQAVAAQSKRASEPPKVAEPEPEWIGLLNALSPDVTRYFGLLLHWYEQGVPTEALQLHGRRRISIADVDETALRDIEPDWAYEFRVGPE